jgi:hypothetical protein
MAAKKLKPAKKKVTAGPGSHRIGAKKKSRGGGDQEKASPKAAKRSLVPKKKAARAAKPVEEPIAPPVLPIPSATFTF